MGRSFTIISTAVITAILTSAIWVFAYNIGGAGGGSRTDGSVEAKGDVATLKPAAGGKPVEVAESVEVGPSGLAIPVKGMPADKLTDTFTAARSGGARRHDAIDIMATEGTPVIAAAPGTVEKLFSSVRGGLTAYVRSDDRKWLYYYAHLQSYAPGLGEGQRVAVGAPIGLVGHTGDASAEGPHLHFAINTMNPDEKWWQGTPINPYPLLAEKQASR